jgi:hypothetical protein
MPKRSLFGSDRDRILGTIDTFPSYKHTPSVADAFLDGASNKTLRHVCDKLFPRHGCRERADFLAFLRETPTRELAKACKEVDVDASGRERTEVLQLLKDREPPNACPICLEKFEPGDAVVVFLCYHEFHAKCAKRAALSQYDATRKPPGCAVCRESLFHTPASKRRREVSGLE